MLVLPPPHHINQMVTPTHLQLYPTDQYLCQPTQFYLTIQTQFHLTIQFNQLSPSLAIHFTIQILCCTILVLLENILFLSYLTLVLRQILFLNVWFPVFTLKPNLWDNKFKLLLPLVTPFSQHMVFYPPYVWLLIYSWTTLCCSHLTAHYFRYSFP